MDEGGAVAAAARARERGGRLFSGGRQGSIYVCCLRIEPFFLPNDISPPGVRAEFSSWRDTNYVVTDCETK